MKAKTLSGILVEKWRLKRRGLRGVQGFDGLAVAREAKRLALGESGWLKSHIKIMDFEGNVLSKFRTKMFIQFEITSDASKVYLLSATGKIFVYNSEGKKLKKYKHGGGLGISEDGSMVTTGDALMDAEGNVIRLPDPPRTVHIVGIAPNGTYVVAHWSSIYTQRIRARMHDRYMHIEQKQNLIYIRRARAWKSVSFNLKNIGMEPKSWYKAAVCAQNSFFAFARKSIGCIDLNGNLKWAFALPYQDEIRQFYVTPDAKYVFFTLKERWKNMYILDAENRKVVETKLDLEIGSRIDYFKVTNDGRKLFVLSRGLIAFDVK